MKPSYWKTELLTNEGTRPGRRKERKLNHYYFCMSAWFIMFYRLFGKDLSLFSRLFFLPSEALDWRVDWCGHEGRSVWERREMDLCCVLWWSEVRMSKRWKRWRQRKNREQRTIVCNVNGHWSGPTCTNTPKTRSENKGRGRREAGRRETRLTESVRVPFSIR